MNDKIEIEENVEIDRASRSSETRETQEARRPWEPPSLLKTPPEPPPPGIKYRWVRTEIRGQEDRKNVMQRISRRMGACPNRKKFQKFDVPTIDHGKHAGVSWELVGLMLCKRLMIQLPEERNQYFEEKTKQ